MKNKIKIILLFVSVIFIFSSRIASAEKAYYYQILMSEDGSPIDASTDFKNSDDCNFDRLKKKAKLDSDVYAKPEDKQTVSSSCIEKEVKEPSKEVVDVTAKENQPIGKYKSTYTLLAPIGDFKEFKTDDIGKYFNILVKLAIGLCGALAVIMIIINGVMYMGEGSIFKKAQAKDGITDAIIGLLIALGSWAILNTINPDLLGGSGLSIRAAKLEIEDETETEPSVGYSSGGSKDLCPSGFVDVITDSGKINMCSTMADKLTNLINDAKKDGIILYGSGSRSIDKQIALRQKNKCPDIYDAPAKECTPPTARPGTSRHEAGLAVDFTCNGETMTESGGKKSPCFIWLSENAKKHGFYNLKSETWHWSDNGK